MKMSKEIKRNSDYEQQPITNVDNSIG